MRGYNTSVRIEGNTGKMLALHFEKDDDKDDKDDKDDEEEDFSDDNEDILTFQVDSLQERDSAGNAVGLTGPSSRKHGVSSLASQIQSYTFSPLDNSSTYQGIPVKNVNLSVSLADPQAKLELIVMLFLRAGNVMFGNETFAVQSGTFKFNIKVRLINVISFNPSFGSNDTIIKSIIILFCADARPSLCFSPYPAPQS